MPIIRYQYLFISCKNYTKKLKRGENKNQRNLLYHTGNQEEMSDLLVKTHINKKNSEIQKIQTS